MCCYNNNGKLDISEKTINNTIELVKDLMNKYNIPIENVVRHYDVTRKVCPAPFVENVSRWNNFKNRLQETNVSSIKPDVLYQVYDNVKKKFLPMVKNTDDYAGNKGNAIGGIRAKLSDGSVLKITSHIKGGKWLSEVSKCDDTNNGYSGIKGKNIDAVMIKSDKHKISYRVHLKDENRWLDWVSGYDKNNSKNGYGGNIGSSIDAIQIRVD